jgi:hypothetical protein
VQFLANANDVYQNREAVTAQSPGLRSSRNPGAKCEINVNRNKVAPDGTPLGFKGCCTQLPRVEATLGFET